MRITILNGEADPNSAFHGYVVEVSRQLEARGQEVRRLDLAAMKLKGCQGCFGCWVRTPGRCVRGDGSAELCQQIMASDLLLWASPMRMGFTSSLLKGAADQMIPLIHPFFVVENGEVHHRARYSRYPEFALLLAPGSSSDAEDIAITEAIWSRTARNLKSRLQCTLLNTLTESEVADEIVRSA